jgi:hypothetical protein
MPVKIRVRASSWEGVERPLPPYVTVAATDTISRLELLVRARYALIVLDTVEPERAEGLVRWIASDLSLHVFGWTRSKGLRRGGEKGDPYIDDTAEPYKALDMVEQEGAGCFHLRELGPHLSDPLVISHVLDVAAGFAGTTSSA